MASFGVDEDGWHTLEKKHKRTTWTTRVAELPGVVLHDTRPTDTKLCLKIPRSDRWVSYSAKSVYDKRWKALHATEEGEALFAAVFGLDA